MQHMFACSQAFREQTTKTIQEKMVDETEHVVRDHHAPQVRPAARPMSLTRV